MANVEKSGTMKYKDKSGNMTTMYPKTKVANVEGLSTELDKKAPLTHTHTKSQISDFPTSMPASDVKAWAKAATKPSYTASEVGADASGAAAQALTDAKTYTDGKIADSQKLDLPVAATSSDGVAYSATVPGATLTAGYSFIMIPNRISSSTSTTLNVNGLGAKALRVHVSGYTGTTSAPMTNNWLAPNKPVRVTCDGMWWIADVVLPSAQQLYGNVQAEDVDYSNTSSGLSATKVQAAIDELAGGALRTQTLSTAEYEALTTKDENTFYMLSDAEETPITPASIGAIPTAEKGVASGVATLGTDGKVPTEQLPEISGGLPFNVEILETICENVTLTKTANIYTFATPITLDADGLYYLSYSYNKNENEALSAADSGYVFSRVTQIDEVSVVRWLSADVGNSVTMSSTNVVDTWCGDSATATISIYKIKYSVVDQLKNSANSFEGHKTTASGDQSHAEGNTTTASGNNAHAEGKETTASGYSSHAEGKETTASGYSSHAEGYKTVASSYQSHAEGNTTTASGNGSHAEGYNTTASGNQSHAEGYNTTANSFQSHAEGNTTTASKDNSHAEGRETTASGHQSHAEGYNTTASGNQSHAEGFKTVASSYQSHAEGKETTASGENSHAEGYNTTAEGFATHVQGKYNIRQTVSEPNYLAPFAHVVGNGTADDARSNAHTLDWSGNAWFAGTVEGTALILKSSTSGSSKRFKITVDDSGKLTATAIT